MGKHQIHNCKECGVDFTNKKSLHAHIKAHKLKMSEYYLKHYPNFSIASGKLIPFKDYDQYTNALFVNRKEMRQYFHKCDGKGAKYANLMVGEYMNEKQIDFVPCEFVLMTSNTPNAADIKRLDILRDKKLQFKFKKPPKYAAPKIKNSFMVDTREQKPFNFDNVIVNKLEIGDYTLTGDDFDNVYVDRKSTNDFLSTFSKGSERFERELKRAVDHDAFLYVVAECSLGELYKKCGIFSNKQALDLCLHNARDLLLKYPDNFQIILAGSRKEAMEATQYLLSYGRKGTIFDYQYLVNTVQQPWGGNH